MNPDIYRELVANPAWRPFTSSDRTAYAILGIVALLLIALTIRTYVGAARITRRRLFVLVGLRLAALALSLLTLIRPAMSAIETPKLPSTLAIGVDASESLTVPDEFNGNTRWEVLKKTLEKCEPILQKLREEQQVEVHLYKFGEPFNSATDLYTADTKPVGKRTNFASFLSGVYNRHRDDRPLRGLLILSDGADNGPPTAIKDEAPKFAGIDCRIVPFALGQANTRSGEKDLAFSSIGIDASPTRVKSDVRVRAKIDAPGYERAKVSVRLRIEGKLADTKEFTLESNTANPIEFTIRAPDKPGEFRVTLETDVLPGELSRDNNTIESWLTVIKGGVRVLVIDVLRPELAGIRQALASDPERFSYVEIRRQTDAPVDAKTLELLDLEKEGYDVVMLGDVSPKRLDSIAPNFVGRLTDAVTKRGVGLVMYGGLDSLSGSPGRGDSGWSGTALEKLLPVELAVGGEQIDRPVSFYPTESGNRHFVLRLDSDARKSAALWSRVNENARTQLGGMTLVGRPRGAAEILARVEDAASGPPILVSHQAGAGRVLAFGGDSTWRWRLLGAESGKTREGIDLHARFWKQMVLWLAKQEALEGNVYALARERRLAVGAKQEVEMGIRDKAGADINPADLKFVVLKPGENPTKLTAAEFDARAVRPNRDASGKYRSTFEPREPGEHTILVRGSAADKEGSKVSGEATSRFLAYAEVSEELLRPGANFEFLIALEAASTGTTPDGIRRIDTLPDYLEKLRKEPVRTASVRSKLYPDWRRNADPLFLPALLVCFVVLLGLEWGLRRVWGLV